MSVPEGYVSLGLVGFTDKGDYDASAIYMQNDLVHKDNAIWKCKVDNTTGITPDENDNWTIFVQSQTSLSGISAVDTYGATGETGEIVVAQELIDAIANRVMNQLVEKAHIINNGLTTEEGYALDARQANPNIENTLAYLLAQLNSNFKSENGYFEVGMVSTGPYFYLRNKSTNNQLLLKLIESSRKIIVSSRVDGTWNKEEKLVTDSDLPAKIYGTETEYVVVGINDSGLYISMNKNTNVLAFQDNGVMRRYDLTSLKLP